MLFINKHPIQLKISKKEQPDNIIFLLFLFGFPPQSQLMNLIQRRDQLNKTKRQQKISSNIDRPILYQLYQMSNPYQSTYVHKHLHYHYHIDVTQTPSVHKRPSSPLVETPQKSGILPTRSSWKNHINPQVTQLYDDINNSTFSDQPSPKKLRQSQKSPKYFETVKQIQFYKHPNSKQELLKDIEKYEQYIKQYSRHNLYIPNTQNLRKLLKPRLNHAQSVESISINNELLENNDKSQKHSEDMLMTRAESKMFWTKQDMDTNGTQLNFGLRDLELGGTTESDLSRQKTEIDLSRQTAVRRSEIKSGQKNHLFDQAKVRMSFMQQPRNSQMNQSDNNSFCLFQRQALKQQNNEQNSKQYPESIGNKVQFNGKLGWHTNKKERTNYHYELLQQQCTYLRNKFIQHAEHQHNIKF